MRYLDDWLTHPDRADPYWAALEIAGGPPGARGPGQPAHRLVGRLPGPGPGASTAGCASAADPVRLVVGPWTHSSAFNQDLAVVLGEALSWLRAYTADAQAPTPVPDENLPVRVHVGGAGEWRDLADWPPPELARQPWYLGAGGRLAAEPPEPRDAAQPGVSSFRYDPADPTPSVGGQLLTGKAGAADNRALEARPDVLVFTSAPLTGALDVIGPVSVRVRVRASGPHFDLFARLCDVDPRGRSRNVCDGIIRHRPGASGGGEEPEAITVPMSATAYQFGPGTGCGSRCRAGRTPGSPATPGPASRPPPRPGWPRWTCRSCTRSATRPCCRFRSCRHVAIQGPGMGH